MLIGGVLGCGLAALLVRLMIGMAPGGIPRLDQVTVDARTLLFAAGTSVLSSMIFGLAPALDSTSPETLVHRGMVGTRRLVRHSLVASQIAVSLVLLTCAGLLIRTRWNLQSVPLGMRTENVIAAPILLRQQGYATSQRQRLFFDDLESRLRAVPGFADVALADSVPLGGPVSDITGRLGTRSHLFANIEIEGRPLFDQGTGGLVAWRRVTPDYFRVLGIPMIRGREFNEEDRRANQNVVIVSESLGQRLFPTEDAIGKRMRIRGNQSRFATIVGIAGNAKNNPGLSGADDPEYYIPRKHDDTEGGPAQAAIILRTSAEAATAINTIRSVVSAMDPALPVTAYTMQHRVSELVARPRFNAVLLAAFAATGVLIAAIGLYGVIAFWVAQRTQEIGVRVALGATSGNILRLVLSAAMRWTLFGVLTGMAGSLFATKLLRSLLFKVEHHDPWTLFGAVALLLSVAAVAAWLPSRRAARTDPIVALRHE